MKYDEAKKQFIQTWGTLGSEWGINRTMAQIHAMLLVSPDAVTTDEIMEELQISRGNANMNLRELMNWNLIRKELVPADRKEYFVAEKDIWEVARRIAKERKRREIEPVKEALSRFKLAEGDQSNPDVKEFTSMMKNLESFVGKMDQMAEVMIKSDQNWFFSMLLKFIK